MVKSGKPLEAKRCLQSKQYNYNEANGKRQIKLCAKVEPPLCRIGSTEGDNKGYLGTRGKWPLAETSYDSNVKNKIVNNLYSIPSLLIINTQHKVIYYPPYTDV